jgi:hypothetical protein
MFLDFYFPLKTTEIIKWKIMGFVILVRMGEMRN